MVHSDIEFCARTPSLNGNESLEVRLRGLFAEQQRLRVQLEQARADLDRVNLAMLKVQEEQCTDLAGEEEYRRCVQELLGVDPYIGQDEIDEASTNAQSAADFLAELGRE